ncbi:hypothetical protein [Nitratifractor sp.]
MTLTNKMPHPMIIQPARAKYLQIVVTRNGRVIWRNYRKDPSEDRQGYFVYRFFEGGHPIVIPTSATSEKVNNLQGHESRTLHYTVPGLKSGDNVSVTLFARLAKEDCLKAIILEDQTYTTPMLVKKVEWTVP